MTGRSVENSWSRSNGALAAWLAIAGFLIATAFGFQAIAGEDEEETSNILFDYEFAIGSVVVYSIIVGLTIAAAQGFPRPRAALGLRAFPLRWLWITLGLTVVAVIVSALLEPLLHAGEEQGLAPEVWQDDRAAAFALNSVVVVFLVPFAEELFFRGLGVRVLGFLGAWVAIVGTALVFALAHGILAGVPALGFFALVLAYVRWRTESVWPGYVAHAGYNAVGILAALYFAMNPDEAAGLAALF
jgi:membrane protease YdiL (CAAX protease family)